MPKLTETIVKAAVPGSKDIILWCSKHTGFMCKVTPLGKKSYFLYYRTQDRRQRRPKIGDHDDISCDKAREIAKNWLEAIRQGKDPSGEKQELLESPTLKELAGRYMQEHAPRKKTSSRKEDLRLWNQHIFPTVGSLKVSSLTRKDVARLHHSLLHLPTTANRVLSLLSKAFNLAELWGYRPNHSNPCLHIKKYVEQKRERFLNQDEINRLMDALVAEEQKYNNPWTVNAIRLLLLTGCRLNEILTLQWDDIDLVQQCFRLRDSKTGKKYVYLSTAALELIMKIPRISGNPYVICGGKEGSHLINLQKPWRRVRAQVGLDNVRLHDLRHTFASIAASKGLSLPIIGALLGHKQTQTTARYAHLIGQPLIEATEMVGDKILNNKRISVG